MSDLTFACFKNTNENGTKFFLSCFDERSGIKTAVLINENFFGKKRTTFLWYFGSRAEGLKFRGKDFVSTELQPFRAFESQKPQNEFYYPENTFLNNLSI